MDELTSKASALGYRVRLSGYTGGMPAVMLCRGAKRRDKTMKFHTEADAIDWLNHIDEPKLSLRTYSEN